MEIRKIQKTGGSTYLISLPKSWVERLGLKQGDHLAIIESRDGALILDPKYEENEHVRETVINAGDEIDIEITAKYLSGFDVIRIKSSTRISPELRDLIKSTKDRLIGVEIVEESAQEIILNCLISPTIIPVRKTLKRIYLLANKMYEEAVNALCEGDVELARNVINRDEEVDRLYFLFVRLIRSAVQDPKLAEKIGISPLECLDYRIIAKNLELIADLAVLIAKKAISLKDEKINEEIIETIRELSKRVGEINSNAMAALFSADSRKSKLVIEMRDDLATLVDKANSVLLKQSIHTAVHLDTVIDCLDKIGEYGSDIAEYAVTYN
ncbi:MAG: PhoU domain-containing protein [Candidatus Odinarchaeia archaeon]